ncbi:hypothetical protein DL771_002577 [Monosporascus sp. 5C6A]|nr:hypothetical protein DL771_002577 [Monosporascus sp. 5C6A]
MKARKGCWTCTARKVQCDGGLPTCNKCARAQRYCQGYEMRLSWPRDGDRRRAIVRNDAPPAVMFPSQGSTNRFFINTTCQDLELYHHLSLRMQPFHPAPSTPDSCMQPQLPMDHRDLVHYFHNSAYLSLVTFGETTQIRDTIMSMALAHDTLPGLALFYALLAFSSLRRYGLNQQAMQLKISALHFLSASVKDEPLISAKAIQHVAASMLLVAFEEDIGRRRILRMPQARINNTKAVSEL